ncbi:MAG: LamG domain-containing protein, partial [Candidatus Omnitrophota bacterium]
AIALAKGQTYRIRWTYINNEATGDDAQTAWVDDVVTTLADEVRAFEHPADTIIELPADYTTDSWVDQNMIAYGDTGFAAQAGAVYSGNESYVQRVIDLSAITSDKTLTFEWKASAGDKQLRVEVYDGSMTLVAQESIAGGTDWQLAAPITLIRGGVYTVKWIYTNNEATGDDTQTAWVDDVRLLNNAIHGVGMAFDGTNDYVRVADNATLDNTAAITVSAWIKTSVKDNIYRRIVDKASSAGYILCMRGDYSGKASLYINGQYASTSSNVADGNWHLITGTYDGTTIRMYVDGVAQGTKAYTGTITANAYDLTIGLNQSTNPGNDAFNGSIDEVAIYDRALAQPEIQEMLTTKLTGNESGMVAYYSFDNDTATDNSPNANDGVISEASMQIDGIINDNLSHVTVTESPFTPRDDGGVWTVLDDGTGNFIYRQTSSGAPIAMMNDGLVTDGSIETKFKLQPSDSDDRAVVYFRMDENGNGYAAQIRRYSTNYGILSLNLVNNYTIGSQVGGDLWFYSLFSNDGGRWHTFKVTFKGDSIKLYVDAQTSFLDIRNSAYTSGNYGLGTRYLNGPAYFDDIIVKRDPPVNDNFSQAPAAPLTPRSDNGSWRLTEDAAGNYVYEQRIYDSSYHIAVVDGRTIQNGTIETKFKLQSDSDENALVYFRMNGSGQGYAARVKRATNDAYIYLFTVNNYSINKQIGDAVKLTGFFLNDEDAWHTLKVELNNESINVYLDNQTSYLAQKHSEYTQGGIALGTYYLTYSAYFDDIVVTDIPVNDDFVQLNSAFTPRSDSGDWQIVKDSTGNYVYEQAVIDTLYHVATLNDRTIQNGTIETKFKLQSDGDENALVYFRMNETGQGYAARVKRTTNDAYLYLYTVNNYSTNKQVGDAVKLTNFFLNDGGAWHTLKVELNNESINVYLDNQTTYLAQKHSEYTQGGVALGTYNLTYTAYFDDIVITDMPVNDDFMQFNSILTPRSDSGDWQIVKDSTGNYVYEQAVLDTSYHVATLNDRTIQNGTIETKFKLAYSSYDSEYAQIYFRMDGNGNGYAAQVRRYNNDAYLTLYTVSGATTPYTISKQIGESVKLTNFFLNDGGAWHTLKVELNNESINVYLDNQTTYLAQKHSEYTQGGIALGTYHLAYTAYFDDIVVTDIPVNDDFMQLTASFIPRTDSGNWQIVKDATGNYVYEQSVLDSSYHIAVMQGEPVENGTIQANFKLSYISYDEEWAIIYFRMNESGNGYAARVRRYNNNAYVYLNYVSNYSIGSQIGGYLTFTNLFTADEYHTLKVELKNNLIRVYLDAQASYISQTDSTYASGAVALGTYALSKPVQFDEIIIPRVTEYNNFSQVPVPQFTPRDDGGNWTVLEDETGNYIYQQLAKDNATHISVLSDKTVGDGTVEAEFKLKYASYDEEWMQLYFRMDSEGNGYAARVRRYNNDATLYLYTVSNYSLSRQLGNSIGFSGLFAGEDVWHTVKVDLEGTSIKVYLDDQANYIHQAHLGNSYGNIAIGTYDIENEAYFDDVVVSRVEFNDDLTQIPEMPFTPRSDSGKWDVIKDTTGNYVYQQSALDDNLHLAFIDDQTIQDGTIDIKFKLGYVSYNEEFARLYFRMDESGNGYVAQVKRYNNDATLTLYTVSGYSTSKQLGASHSFTNFFLDDGGAWHELKVALDNSLIKVYLDSQIDHINQKYDGTTVGAIAIGTYDLETEAYFDDIKITEAPVINNFAGLINSPATPRSDNANWQMIALDDGTGNYVYMQSFLDSDAHIAFVNDQTIQNGTIETKFKVGYDYDDRVRLYFRMNDSGNGYAVQIRRYYNDAHLYLYTVSNYNMDKQIGGMVEFANFFLNDGGAAHDLKIALDGSSIKVYLDNQTKYIDQKHSGYASGNIAIGTYALNSEAYFDDIIVKESPVINNFAEIKEMPFTPRSDGGNWHMIDDGAGNYVYMQSLIDSSTHIAMLNNQTIQNGIIETKFRLGYDSDDRIRLYFRMDENGNGYAAQVKRSNNDASITLYTVSAYSMNKQIGGTRSFSNFFLDDGGAWHELKIALDGSSIKVYLDDQVNHIDQKHLAYTSGNIGIGTYALTKEAYFEDVVVTESPVINNFAEMIAMPITPRNDNGNWHMIDDGAGNYVYMQSLIDDDTHIAMFNDKAIQNGTIETKFKLGYDSDDRIRLYFRMNGSGNGYAAQVKRYYNDAYLYLYTVTAYALDKQIGGAIELEDLFLNDNGMWHDLKIALDGSSINIYLDNQTKHISQKHSAYSSGSIGIGTYNLESEAYFEDVAVTESPVINNFSDLVGMPFTTRNDGGNWQMIDDGTGNYVYMQSLIDGNTHIAMLNDQAIQDGTIESKFRLAY